MNRPSLPPRTNFEAVSQDNGDCSSNSSPIGPTSPSMALRNEHIAPDFSIFSTHHRGDFLEPIPMDENRTPQQQTALRSMLKESVEFLFGKQSSSQTKNQLLPIQVESSLPVAALQAETPQDLPEAEAKRGGNKYESVDLGESTGSSRKRIREPDSSLVAAGSPILRFRPYQSQAWDDRFDDLLAFRRANGHCTVPYAYPQNPALARWVKRQRYQYKLHQEEKPSTMTEQRIRALEHIGFVWDAHSAAWEERLSELRKYREANGDCNVPTNYEINKKLAAWVKCQRRQYKLHMVGKPSTLTEDRIATLDEMGFHWEVRVFKVER